MEKKAEKQNDFILKPESDEVATSGDVLPELVSSPESTELESKPSADLGTSPTSDDPQPSDPLAESFSIDPSPINPSIDPKHARDTLEKTDIFASVKSEKKPVLPAFVRQTLLPLLIVFLVVIIVLIPIKNAMVWYQEAPRTSYPGAVSFVPSIFTAWIGDADASYALQLAPIMMKDSDEKADERKQFRNITLTNAERFLQQTGNAPQSLTRIAGSLALTSEGRSKEAADIIQVVADNASNPMIKAYHALLLAANGDMKTALSEVDRGLALDQKGEKYISYTNSFFLWWEKAQILQAMGKPAEALALLNSPECLASTKDGSMSGPGDVLVSKASAYLQLGEPDKAIALYEGIKAPNHIVLFLAYLLKNDYDRAFREAAEISSTPNLALSRIYSQKGQLEQALDYAEKAEMKSRNLLTLEQHVHVLNQLGRWKESLTISQNPSAFANLINLSSPGIQCQSELHALRAEAYANLGESANALVEAKMALNINPDCRRALEAARLASSNLRDPGKVEFYESQLRHLTTPINYRPVFFTGATGE